MLILRKIQNGLFYEQMFDLISVLCYIYIIRKEKQKMERIVFHIDVNSAFLSWQAAYNKHMGYNVKDLRSIPAVVGGDEKNRRGVVLAKSEIAKKYGVRTGMSLFEARKLCPVLVSVKPDFKIYRMYSDKLFNLLSEYSDTIERYSIDECFLDYTGSLKLFGSPEKVAYEIKERVKRELGFSVNIGISTNKLLAKMAGDLMKPDKVITLYPKEIEEKMFPLNISELFMVGRKTKEKLNNLGIYTIGDLNRCSLDFLIAHFKKAQGIMLYNYSHGIDESEVSMKNEIKSIGNSTTLGKDVTNINEVKRILLSLSDSVGTRLRKNNYKGNVINVSIKNSSFYLYSHRKTLSYFTSSTNTIYEESVKLFLEFWNKDPIRLLGISVSGFDNAGINQLSLLDRKEENEKMARVERVMDNIRLSYGKDIIKRGVPEERTQKNVMNKLDYFK